MTRQQRRYNTERVVEKRYKLAKHLDYHDGWYPVEELYYNRGYFKKKAPFDCGKTKCYCCHGDKLLYKNTKFKGFRL